MRISANIACLVLFCLVEINVNAQQTFSSTDPNYINLVQAGEKALGAEKFDSCLVYYKDAFEIKQTSFLSTMRAAACAFMGDQKDLLQLHLDSAFSINWGGAKQVFDLNPEFEIVRGTDLEEIIKKYYNAAAEKEGLDVELMEELQLMRKSDQEQRQHMREYDKLYGRNSAQMDSLWQLQNETDALNTKRVCEIIDRQGYPGKSIVGESLSSSAFLIIQHADLEIQEKYLKIITDAADAKEVPWRSVALLVDRVLMRQGKKQIYGSQVSSDPETNESFFAPIEQPFKVDSIRTSVGLGPLKEYAEYFDFEWDPAKHIKRQEIKNEHKN